MCQFIKVAMLLLSVQVSAQHLEKGIEQFNNEEFDAARKTLEAINSDHSQYEEVLFYLGRVAFDKLEYRDARDYFKSAIKKNDQVSKYHTWYGNSMGTIAQDASKIRQGILAPKIKNAYKKAVELDPGDMDAQWGLMEFYSQAPGVMGGSWEKAIAASEAIFKIDPKQGLLAKATVLERKKDFESAESEYIELSKIDENYIYDLGMFYQGRQQFEKAFSTFEHGLEKQPENWSVLYQVGRTSALSGMKAERGIQCLQLYMENDRGKSLPSRSAAKSRLAMIYEKQGDVQKAKTLYQEALSDDPKMDLAKEGLKRIKD